MHRRTRRIRRAVPPCAVLAAASLTLFGCSSGEPTPARSAQVASPHAAPQEAAGQSGQQGQDRSTSASHVPTLPDSRLTPATGSFTKQEKKYLSGRVPANMDPAAVLQLGQEACQRVQRTAAHDRDAAVGAVISGDIPGARDAIAQLCPDQAAVLHAAESGFPDGTKKRPAAGTYRALTPSASCTWRALDASGKKVASGGATGADGDAEATSGKKITARIPAGTRTFVSSGCYAWVRA